MTEVLTLQLEDGTELEAVLEGDESDADLLRSGRLRIAAGDSDVEGHGAGGMLGVIVYGPDDVEGHAMTLRLPHVDAARDLQRKLLAAGVAGDIVVGAPATTMWVADQGISLSTETAAPAAPISRGLQAERGMDQVATAVPADTAEHQGMKPE